VPPDLPPSVSAFVGREAELQILRQAAASSVPCVQIVGAPGIGKTELALKAAWELHTRFARGVTWVNGEQTAPDDAARQLLRVGGLEPAADETRQSLDLLRRERAALAGRLIVLDGVDTWSDADLDAFVPTARGSLIILTSRRHLGRPDPVLSLGPLSQDEALTLLRAVVGPPQIEGHEATALELAQLLDGHPLALRMVAATLKYAATTLDKVVEQIRDEGRWLASDDSEDGSSPRAQLAAVLELSLDALDDSQRQALQAGAVFEGAFDADAIAYLLDREGDRSGAEKALNDLARLSLLQPLTPDRPGRFTIHPVIRAYLLAHPHPDEMALKTLLQRHGRYMLRLIKSRRTETRYGTAA
jgi:hypothetical protein